MEIDVINGFHSILKMEGSVTFKQVGIQQESKHVFPIRKQDTTKCILEFYIKENETNGSVKGSFSHLTKGAYPRSSVTCAKLT